MSSGGRSSSSSLRSAGKPFGRRVDRPAQPGEERVQLLGARFAVADSVGLELARRRPQVGDTGSVSAANWSRRVSVARDSRRKVGKTVNSVLEVLVALGGGREHRLARCGSGRASWPWRSESASKTSPPLRTKPLTASRWLSRIRSARSASSANGSRLAIATERSSPRPRSAAACALHPGLERGPGLRCRRCGRSRRAGPTSDDLRRRQVAALGQRRRLVAARGQLDVGLAEQRLLAQDRPRVVGDRRVARVQLDRRLGVARVAQVDRLDLADRDAGDPHVRLLGELRRLVERRPEPVALRLQRDRAAERDPQEQRQGEAREREADGDQDPGDCRWPGLHRLTSGAGGSRRMRRVERADRSALSGTLVSCCSVRRNGRGAASALGEAGGRGRTGARRRARSGPVRVLEQKSALVLWLSQASQNR